MHLTVKTAGLDGIRLNPRKADIQRWREGFAEALRDQGIDATTTSSLFQYEMSLKPGRISNEK